MKKAFKWISGAVAWLWSDRATGFFAEHQVLGTFFWLAVFFLGLALAACLLALCVPVLLGLA